MKIALVIFLLFPAPLSVADLDPVSEDELRAYQDAGIGAFIL